MIRTMRLSSGNDSYNFRNQGGGNCGDSGCYSEMKYVDSAYACVYAWATTPKFGWGICTPERISSRVSEFQKVEIKAVLSEEGVSYGDPFQLKLAIRVNSSWYPSEWFDEPGLKSKSWTVSPKTDEPWTSLEVRNTRMQVQVQVPAGEAFRRGIVDVFWMELTFTPAAPLVSTDDETNITNSSVTFNGEITDGGGGATERGFEYYKDGEPDNVLIHKETGEFINGVYSLGKGSLVAGTKYYFRAYALNETGTGYGGWQNFTTTALPPTLTTQEVTDIAIANALGHGTIVTTGGEVGVYKCIERGFEVRLTFSGRLGDYVFHNVAGFEGSVEFNRETGNYEGTLIKRIEEEGEFDPGVYELWLARTPHTVFANTLFPGESYHCRAYAINEEEFEGYGDWQAFTTLEVLIATPGGPPDGGPVSGPYTILKNETIQGLEEGEYATRRGFRYGTNESANEFDVHENGFFYTGPFTMMLPDLLPATIYYIVPYVVINRKYYEGEMEIVETEEEEGEEEEEEEVFPEDEFTTPYYGPHGQDYREVEIKVFAERLSLQGIIDYCGGKKTLPINNHLIQTRVNARTICSNYLNRFQYAKTKMTVKYPTPLPFEKEDTVDLHHGAVLYRADDEGVVLFRADGAGRIKFRGSSTMMIRKIDMDWALSGDSIDYLATLELEEE